MTALTGSARIQSRACALETFEILWHSEGSWGYILCLPSKFEMIRTTFSEVKVRTFRMIYICACAGQHYRTIPTILGIDLRSSPSIFSKFEVSTINFLKKLPNKGYTKFKRFWVFALPVEFRRSIFLKLMQALHNNILVHLTEIF